MALELLIRGTIHEIQMLGFWTLDELAEILCIDYYKLNQVPADEIFTITQEELKRITN